MRVAESLGGKYIDFLMKLVKGIASMTTRRTTTREQNAFGRRDCYHLLRLSNFFPLIAIR